MGISIHDDEGRGQDDGLRLIVKSPESDVFVEIFAVPSVAPGQFSIISYSGIIESRTANPVTFGEWGVKCRVQSVECRVSSVVYAVWSV